MLGLFDSGSGGLNTIRYIKKYFPSVDLVYKIDRENSPYGTKTQEKIIQITKNNIDDLMSRGAEKILIDRQHNDSQYISFFLSLHDHR